MNKKSIGILAYYWPPAGGSGVQDGLGFQIIYVIWVGMFMYSHLRTLSIQF